MAEGSSSVPEGRSDRSLARSAWRPGGSTPETIRLGRDELVAEPKVS
jgi:hypothetical protein